MAPPFQPFAAVFLSRLLSEPFPAVFPNRFHLLFELEPMPRAPRASQAHGTLHARCVGDAEDPLICYLHASTEGNSSANFNPLVLALAETMQASRRYQAVVRPLRDRYQAVVRPLRGRYQAVVRPLLGRYWAVVRPLRDRYQAVVRPLRCRYQAVVRPLLGRYWAVVRPLPDRE